MRKKAQYSHDQVGLAPGLPSEIEMRHYAGNNSQQASGLSSWLPYLGATAGGLIGWHLLKKRHKGLEAAAKKALTPKTEAAAADAATSAAPVKRSPAEILDQWAQTRGTVPKSDLYPEHYVGTQSGNIAQDAMRQHPDLILQQLKKNKNWTFQGENVDPRQVISNLRSIANTARGPVK